LENNTSREKEKEEEIIIYFSRLENNTSRERRMPI